MSGFSEEFRRELDAIGPSGGQLDALVERLERERPAPSRTGRRALVALAVCAALGVTALAVGPTVWQRLEGLLGGFSQYTAPMGAVSVSEGIEMKAVGSLSDGIITRVYLSATDLTGDRLNGHTEGKNFGVDGKWLSGIIDYGLSPLSYDGESKTLLMELTAEGLDFTEPATVGIGMLRPGVYSFNAAYPDLSLVGTGPLQTERTAEGATVLAPGQNPQTIDGLDGLTVSSMGFGDDGKFHLRLVLEPGGSGAEHILADPRSATGETSYQAGIERVTLPDGVDIVLPALTRAQWGDVAELELYGQYHGAQADIAGKWRFEVQLEAVERRQFDVDFQYGGCHIDWVQVSPLGVTARFTAPSGGGLFDKKLLRMTLADGTAPEVTRVTGSAGTAGPCYAIWNFKEPVALDEIISAQVAGLEVWE